MWHQQLWHERGNGHSAKPGVPQDLGLQLFLFYPLHMSQREYSKTMRVTNVFSLSKEVTLGNVHISL